MAENKDMNGSTSEQFDSKNPSGEPKSSVEKTGEDLVNKMKGDGADKKGLDSNQDSPVSLKDSIKQEPIDKGQGLLSKAKGSNAENPQKDNAVDKLKDTGKKVAKEAAAPTAKTGAAVLGGNMAMGAMNQAATASVGFFAALVGFIVDAAVGVLGFVGGLIAGFFTFTWSMMVGTLSAIASIAGIVLIVVSQSDQVQRARAADEAFRCNDHNVENRAKQKISASKKGELSADDQARIDENSKKTLSVLSEYGLDTTQIAAVLGAWTAESNIQPRRYETDHIVKDKYDLLEKEGPTAEALVGGWGSFLSMYGGGLNEDGYKVDGKHFIGVGLGQWTGPRAKQLWDFSKSIKKSMFDMDTQLAFMISDNDSGKSRLDAYKEASKGKSVDEATSLFLSMWEGVPGNKLGHRQQAAAERLIAIKKMSKDKEYAASILSLANVKASSANNKQAKLNEKDDCGVPLKDSGAVDYAEDGTGEFPAGIIGYVWKPQDLPKELKPFVKDPSKVGMAYGSRHGWAEGSGQCVDLTESYGSWIWRGASAIVSGNGNQQANAWAQIFGTKVSKDPIRAGAIFSTPGPSQFGHTGIVVHVFKNRDIMVVEQNYADVSGIDRLGIPNTWDYRYIKKEQYEQEGMTFAAPKEGKPNWGGKGK